MKANIAISDDHLQEVSLFLNRLLANEFMLYSKTRAAHWNIEGPNFIGLHKFFKSQYEELDLIIDDTAERIRSLGHFAIGLLKDFIGITDMVENSDEFGSQKQILTMLTHDHETIIRIIRTELTPLGEKYRDLGSADFVTGLIEKHEKMAWMLRAHL